VHEVIIMCVHETHCPSAETPDARSAEVVAPHPEQGWCLLCNGVILFDDGGTILPDGTTRSPATAA
jgi:hypothetical protein